MKISAILVLIGVNVIVFLLQQGPSNGLLEQLFALYPLQPLDGHVYFRFWQIITYSFLHGGTTHLLFNMVGLWVFGTAIERYVGPFKVLACYFASVITAALSQLYVPMLFGAEPAPTIGASGGLFGLILAYAVMFPHRKLIALILPIPMPAWLFAILFSGLELFLGVTGAQTGVAHFAHLGGMVGSALVLTQWRARAAKTR
jgi:membrane associated rhomboid family serine protease